jgi:hypothetical protein
MKTIVLVTDIAFWENNFGSHMRIRSLLRYLAQHHHVTVFFLRTLPADARAALASAGLSNVGMVGYKDYSGRRRPFHKDLCRMACFRDRAVDDFVSSLTAFLAERPADMVILEYIRLAYLLDGCPAHIPTVLDMHDVMSARTVSLRRAGLKPSIELPLAEERVLLGRFDRVLAISRADLDHVVGSIGLSNVIYAPYSVPKARRHDCRGDGRRLIFVGANSAPNVEGLRWFLAQVWPLLRSEDFRLDVVGTVCDAFGESPDGVVWRGQQDDLSHCLDEADIAINPVFVGGGLKIKCIDSLAAGLPCITTAEGAAGLEAARGCGLFVARTRLDFAAAIRYLSRSPEDRRLVAKLAPQFVENEFTDGSAYRHLARYLESCFTRPALVSA